MKNKLLVVSVAASRLPHIYVTMSSINDHSADIFEHINSRDIEMAENIKNYYQNKLTILMLKDSNISKFRRELLKLLVASENNSYFGFGEDMVRLSLSLPRLYQYDLEMDKIKEELFDRKHSVKENHIQLLKKLKCKKHNEYWFVDHDNELNCLKLEKTNNLSGLWDSFLSANNNILEIRSIHMKTINRIIDGLKYKQITRMF
jgi:hypothetical protein